MFQFSARSSLLLLFVGPGLVAALWLLVRASRRGTAPDALLALLLLVPTLSVAHWMLGYAGWYDSHDGYSTFMFYVPWQLELVLGPAYFLYFKSLTNQEFDWRHLRRHLLPGLLQAASRGVAALYDLGWWRGLRGRPLPYHFGTQGAWSKALDYAADPLAWVGHLLLLAYALRTLADYRRYRHYLTDNFSDPERLRFAGLRQLLLLELALLALNVGFAGLSELVDFSYDAAWYFYFGRGLLIYGLVAVGIQANYAAATSPLRFGAAAPAATPPEPAELVPARDAALLAGPTETEPTVAVVLAAAPALAPAAFAPATLLPNLNALPPELLPWRDKLLALMATQQPWLEPELTLAELAQRLRTNPGLLSKVINAGCGQNFNDFVNTYRVAEARRKLADPRFAHYSLVGVALESGFNSKSTFNRVFRKLAGVTPGELARPKA